MPRQSVSSRSESQRIQPSRARIWPDYAQHAAHGVLSSLSVPLPFQGATIGAARRRSKGCRPMGPGAQIQPRALRRRQWQSLNDLPLN
jgi:hypothetical protein